MNKILNFLWDLILCILIALVVFLTAISWNYNLQSNKESDVLKETYITMADVFTPINMAIKVNGEVFTDMFHADVRRDNYNTIKDEVFDIMTSNQAVSVVFDEYNSAFLFDNYIFIEFNAPFCEVFDVNSVETLNEMIIFENFIYYKTENGYFKISNSGIKRSMNFSSTGNFINDDGFYLVSNESASLPILNFNEDYDVTSNEQIIKLFEYNPYVVSSYSSDDGSVSYIGDYGDISVNQQFIEFSTNDPRGYIFANDAVDTYELIDFSKGLFSNIYAEIGSSIYPVVSKIMQDGKNIVIYFDGFINGFSYNYNDYAGVFVFNNFQLSYAKINLISANLSEELQLVAKNNIFSKKVSLRYDESGKLNYYTFVR